MNEATPGGVEAPSARDMPESAKDRLADLILSRGQRDAQTAALEGAPEDAVEEEAAPDAGEAQAETAADESADVAEQPEEQPEEEPPPAAAKGENARLAKALVDLERAQARSLRMEQRVKDLEKRLEEAASDPEKALALAKTDPEALIQAMLDGRVKKKDDPQLSEEQKALKELQTRLAEIERERDEARHANVKRQELDVIQQQLNEREILSAFPWAAERVYENYYAEYQKTGEQPDLDDVIDKVERIVEEDLKRAIASEKALKRLGLQSKQVTEKSKPARQESERATPPKDGPKVVTQQMTSEVPARSTAANEPTPEERASRGIDILLSRTR